MRTGFLWRVALPVGLGVGVMLWLLGGDRQSDADPRPPSIVVALTARPLIMLTRGDIHIDAHVPAHADNRRLAIAWTSDVGSSGETQRVLDGNDAETHHDLWLHAQPPANYVFFASVFDAHGTLRGRAEARIVTPDGPQ